jgi:hypothetical protein
MVYDYSNVLSLSRGEKKVYDHIDRFTHRFIYVYVKIMSKMTYDI